MATVPSFGAPGFGADIAALHEAIAKSGAARTAAQLEAQSNVLRGVMQNADRIAEVSGSGALDRIARGPGGQEQDLFGGDYASAMDRLRQSAMQADIAAANRRGTGGAGAGTPKDIKPGEFIGDDGNVYTWNSFDDATIAAIMSGQGPVKVARGGPVYKGPGAVTSTPAAPNEVGANGKVIVERFDDGSVIYDDGTAGVEE